MLNHGFIRQEIRPEDVRSGPIDRRPFLIEDDLESSGVSDKAAVYDRFVQLGPRAVPVVMEELSDANTSARQVAMLAAGRLCNPQAIATIVPFLADKDNVVKLVACYVLIRMGTPRAVQAAFAAACDEKDSDIQGDMIDLFGKSHETQAESALIVGLKHGKVEVRRMCAWALRESDDSRVPGALKEAAGDPDEQVRNAATDGLKDFQLRHPATNPASK